MSEDAELERLHKENLALVSEEDSLNYEIIKKDAEIQRLKALLVQCAEAIAYCHVYRINEATIEEHRELMKRVREVTK